MKWIFLSMLALAISGCVTVDEDGNPVQTSRTRRTEASKPKPKPKPKPAENLPSGLSPTDPCAERLHALCGPLLLYYQVNRKLPAAIDDLRDIAGPDPEVAFTCPESGKPYVLYPDGLRRGANQPGIILISDAEPSHEGLRWAIAVEEPRNTAQPLITRVVADTEAVFQSSSQRQQER